MLGFDVPAWASSSPNVKILLLIAAILCQKSKCKCMHVCRAGKYYMTGDTVCPRLEAIWQTIIDGGLAVSINDQA